jgi:hypothetical protein
MGKFESVVVGAPRPLSELELESHISVPRAAAIKGISPDTFKRHYADLIIKASPRRNTVKLRTLLGR